MFNINTCNAINNIAQKQYIIDFLFNNVNIALYKYILLEKKNNIKFLKNNFYYVAKNIKNTSYFLIFLKYNNKNYSVLVNRKQLKYNKNDININSIVCYDLNLDLGNDLYNGTILEGKILSNIFYIHDCYYIFNNIFVNINLREKLNYIQLIIYNYINTSILEFKIIELYTLNNMLLLINNVKHQANSSIIFYPEYSGTNVIFINRNIINNDNTDSCIEKFNNNDNNNNDINNNNANMINIGDYKDYMLRTTYSHDYYCKKNLWLIKTKIYDVYKLSSDKTKSFDEIAYIPNTKISLMCNKCIKFNDVVLFECIFSTRFNKWIPINLIK